MRAGPTGKSIGAEARMDQCERRLDGWIAKVRIERRQLIGREHTFVNDGAGRKAGDIEHAALVNSTPRPLADSLSNHIELALKSRLVRKPSISSNKNLPDYRLRSSGCRPKPRIFRSHGAPTEYALAFIPHDPFKQSLAFTATRAVPRQEHHPYAVVSGGRQFKFPMLALAREKLVGNLEQNAGAVTSVNLATASAPMV